MTNTSLSECLTKEEQTVCMTNSLDSLDKPARDRIREHLAICPFCREEMSYDGMDVMNEFKERHSALELGILMENPSSMDKNQKLQLVDRIGKHLSTCKPCQKLLRALHTARMSGSGTDSPIVASALVEFEKATQDELDAIFEKDLEKNVSSRVRLLLGLIKMFK